ncbi:hypothetical protein F5050DRAFT_1499827 [Lentinula boryana]|uniref:Secreted protein n=1 Tax=Lentinula boryana TaxID=40481 RepID=A0ABQ8QEM4_9AGAR|nr:hypothetical protein F5050DRAFT_1499827 [Lentinula boryana]
MIASMSAEWFSTVAMVPLCLCASIDCIDQGVCGPTKLVPLFASSFSARSVLLRFAPVVVVLEFINPPVLIKGLVLLGIHPGLAEVTPRSLISCSGQPSLVVRDKTELKGLIASSMFWATLKISQESLSKLAVNLSSSVRAVSVFFEVIRSGLLCFPVETTGL